jgi:hypothetical protein
MVCGPYISPAIGIIRPAAVLDMSRYSIDPESEENGIEQTLDRYFPIPSLQSSIFLRWPAGFLAQPFSLLD